ncbi:MAG: hypothetical protein BYD32DRAFT_420201 [Podila humilis]|nr:MAG: hypothetical protein BYD32DRAFT_420201 [Podila humilis]
MWHRHCGERHAEQREENKEMVDCGRRDQPPPSSTFTDIRKHASCTAPKSTRANSAIVHCRI